MGGVMLDNPLPEITLKGKPRRPDFLLTKEIRRYYNLPKIQVRRIVDYFLCVLGMVMIVEGLPYFAAPSKIKAWVQKLVELPDSSLRLIGFLLMSVGLGLVYLGRQ
jgi:uncharacterized protein YjeT (DUF2065 family)